jgi:hypothetical protein
MGIHQGPGPRILTIYIRTAHSGIDRECNSTEQNGRRRRRREIERKREKERMKRVSGSNQTTFSQPSSLASLFWFCSTTSPTSRKKDRATNTHAIAIATFF